MSAVSVEDRDIRWSRIITRQRAGEFGQLTALQESVFSVLAHWPDGIDLGELASRAGWLEPQRCLDVCAELQVILAPHDFVVAYNKTTDTVDMWEIVF